MVDHIMKHGQLAVFHRRWRSLGEGGAGEDGGG
jgi:hypothetical protein